MQIQDILKNSDISWEQRLQTLQKLEPVEPDKWDLAMLKEIEENPDCHEFIPQEELMKILGIQ